MCRITITAPMIKRQTRQATTIKASELVGLMKSSKFQLFTFDSVEKIMSYEFGMIGVHFLIDLSPLIEMAALKFST
jgi:hypothetical protein